MDNENKNEIEEKAEPETEGKAESEVKAETETSTAAAGEASKKNSMPKVIAVIAAVCVILACVMVLQNRNTKTEETAAAPVETAAAETIESAAPEESAAPAESTESTADAETGSGDTIADALNFGSVYALYDPDEVVMTINGTDITWAEYAYEMFYVGYSLENTFLSYYGSTVGWDNMIAENTTFNQYLHQQVEAIILQSYGIGELAEKNGISLSEEELAAIETQKQANITTYCGEGATEEDFEAFLATMYMIPELYQKMNEESTLTTKIPTEIYGENGEKLSDEDVIAYMEANDYLYAAHILLPTIDLDTREALSEEEIAAAKEQAETLAKELQAIENEEERLAKFYEYMETYSKDTGKTAYPEGYLFTSGQMVTEFEEGTRALENYQVSDPILSSYGYHIIMRLPLKADAVLSVGSDGTAQTVHSTMVNDLLSEELSDIVATAKVTYVKPVNEINLADYAA